MQFLLNTANNFIGSRIFKVIILGSLIIYILLYGLVSCSAVDNAKFKNNIPEKSERPSRRPNWFWECQDGNCVRITSNVKVSSNFSSIQECRLVCNPYSTLWPIPTGAFEFSRETQAINISAIAMSTDHVKGGKEARHFVRKNGIDCLVRNLFALCPQSERIQYYVKQKALIQQNDDVYDGTPKASVKINVITTDPLMILNMKTDESYNLRINSSDEGMFVEISAANVFGARHALQTLSQLFACKKGDINTLVMLTQVNITDKPIYSHRGLLLDTARTFFPVKAILRTLDGMAASKLNVFHWHITDSHSFPLYTSRVPNLTKYGAYSEDEIYRPEDIKLITDYAFIRGIRIIPEIDAPSHAGYGWQWGESAGLGNLAVCVGHEPWHECCVQPPCGQLNPSNPNVYTILHEIYSEIREQFPHDMFHMGGDEVFFPCWLSSLEITHYMMQSKYNQTAEGYIQLWSEFQHRALDAWEAALPVNYNSGNDRNPVILWTSALTDPQHVKKYLDPEKYVIEAWTEKHSEESTELLKLGYKVIMATKDAWYLDHGFTPTTVYHRWTDVYDNIIPPPDEGVLGGEVCLWSEYVGDSNLDSRLWPRASCLGERLWSDPKTNGINALPRLLDHTARLTTLGLEPDVIIPEWCMMSDGKCP